MTVRTLIRDSIFLLLIGAGVLFVRDAGEVLPFLLGGLIAIANLGLLSLLVRRVLHGVVSEDGGGTGLRLAAGMMVKLLGTAAALALVLKSFELTPVLLGLGVVVASITLRGVFGLFMPVGTQEA